MPKNYYDMELEDRRSLLAAGSVDQLCKSLILANKADLGVATNIQDETTCARTAEAG